MVFYKGFNIRICRRGTDSYYPDFHKDGKAYVVAVPNQEFIIQILAPDNLGYICKNGLHASLKLAIDGNDVGYSKSIRAGEKAVFDGFLTKRDTVKASGYQAPNSRTAYRNFKFASTLDANSSSQTASPHLGEVKVSLQLGFKLALISESIHRDITPASNKAPEDGKKFFMAPSLRTQPGTTETREEAWSSFYTRQTAWEFVVHYETAATLLLRKVLEPANPAHAAIIALSQEPSGGCQGPGTSSVKRERGVLAPGIIDVTREHVPRLCRKDEDIFCDMTGDSPVWEIKKKPRLEAEVVVL